MCGGFLKKVKSNKDHRSPQKVFQGGQTHQKDQHDQGNQINTRNRADRKSEKAHLIEIARKVRNSRKRRLPVCLHLLHYLWLNRRHPGIDVILGHSFGRKQRVIVQDENKRL
jgi:hypothetical protein